MLESQLPTQVIVIGTLIAILFLIFLWKYLVPGWAFWFKLKGVLKDLRELKAQGENDPGEVFKRDRVLAHLWAEYTETLHEQKSPNPQTAIEEVVAVRATLPAEAFFSSQALVDSRLHAEFFKHAPGLFTGLGIIGTFLGLIHGLRAFQISEKPEVVRQSLDLLLHGVYEAFLISASAIILAMLVTFLEKWLLSGLYRQVEELCYLIDSFFESGAGEEYLARLVKASEDSASQSKILKDSLVGELKQILSEISQQQIQASHASQQHLGEQLIQSIETGIRQPISSLVEGFTMHREKSGEDLSAALADVLAAFTQKIQDIFGGQITGINELQQKTIDALQSAVSQLGLMATNVDAAGRNATDTMANKLTEAMSTMEARQQVMNDQMAEFVGKISTLVADSQSETGHKLQTLLGDLGQQVATMVAELQAQASNATENHAGQQQQLSENMTKAIHSITTEMNSSIQGLQGQMAEMLGGLEAQSVNASNRQAEQQSKFAATAESSVSNLTRTVEQVVTKVSDEASTTLSQLAVLVEKHQVATAEATHAMQAAVLGIREVTNSAVTKMNQGADTLYLAADEFGKAGQSVSGVLTEATGVARELSSSASSVSNAARSFEGIIGDYRAAHETLADMVSALNETVDAARNEASLTTDILSRIDGAAAKLATAQDQADKYLDEVSQVLAGTHQEFASNMRATLGEANKQFYSSLSEATSLLREGIQELDATLGGFAGSPAAKR